VANEVSRHIAEDDIRRIPEALLRQLDVRERRVVGLFLRQKTIRSRDVAGILGISTRQARNPFDRVGKSRVAGSNGSIQKGEKI